MKNRVVPVLIALLAIGTSGCVSHSYRRILVSVVDSNTHEPVEGARVSTAYPFESWFYRVLHPDMTAFTGRDGLATVKANPNDTLGPVFDVKVVNERYDQHLGHSETGGDWRYRAEDFVPTKPDIVVEVTSRAEEKRAEEEAEAKHKADEREAENLFQNSPDYWPATEDEIGEILVFKRWEHASKTPLGSKEDVESIRAAVIQHMKHPRASVNEIRWISPNVVMVASSWYSSPLAAAGYRYVLRKNEQGWVVLVHYMEFIS